MQFAFGAFKMYNGEKEEYFILGVFEKTMGIKVKLWEKSRSMIN